MLGTTAASLTLDATPCVSLLVVTLIFLSHRHQRIATVCLFLVVVGVRFGVGVIAPMLGVACMYAHDAYAGYRDDQRRIPQRQPESHTAIAVDQSLFVHGFNHVGAQPVLPQRELPSTPTKVYF